MGGNKLVMCGKQSVLTERMKRTAMTIPVQQQANHTGTALTRTDVMRLLQDVGSPEQLDVSGQNLSGINLMNCDLRGANLCEADLREADLSWADAREADLRGANLDRAILYGAILGRADLRGVSWETTDVRGADLSWDCLGEANAYELKHRLRHRGAIFRETTNVKVAERFSDTASTFALGFSLGFLFIGVVGFLGMLGMRVMCHFLKLKRLLVH